MSSEPTSRPMPFLPSDDSVGAPLSVAAGGFRICEACGDWVARHACHKTRHAQYICHVCQRAGVELESSKQLLPFTMSWRYGLLVALGVAVGLLAIWLLYAAVEKLT